MSLSVKMPALGESVTEGTVTRWLKKEGDEITTDEPLLEVSTDKVDTEIPAPATGVLLRILAHEDEVVAVGAELAVIGEANEAPLRSSADDEPGAAAPTAEPEPEPEPAAPSSPAAQPEPATPAAPVAPTGPVAPTSPQPEPAVPAAASGGASTAVVLPPLGESVTEGTVTRWLKQVGDQVAADEPLLEVSTDKVDTEIPAPAAGVLVSIAVGEDQVAEVGAQLGLIGVSDSASDAATAAAPAPTPASPPAPTPEASPATPPASPAAPAQAPAASPAETPATAPTPAAAAAATTENGQSDVGYVTPLVRKLAAEYAVDLASVKGTGVGGRIRKQDVLDAAKLVAQKSAQQQAAQPSARPQSTAAAQPTSAPTTGPSPLRGRTEPMSRLRKVIAERLVDSLQKSAQLTTVMEVDVTRISRLRDRAKRDFQEREGVKLTFLPFFAKATVEALKVHPSLNASIDSEAGTVTYHDVENLGVAVDTERGLLVPVIQAAGDLNISGLAKRIADVAERTRSSKISPDELSGGTFTLTNTGSRGALFDTPIINQPQVAILGTGAVVKRAVVVTDETGAESIAIRSMVYLALTYDHRLVDGADAARFLITLKERLEEGAFDNDLGV
ncbi:MAG: 2-oxoglutarate dehydrogenase, E2 component, dihydrolipoamide succinyltransferase [Actinomycetes bacterium]